MVSCGMPDRQVLLLLHPIGRTPDKMVIQHWMMSRFVEVWRSMIPRSAFTIEEAYRLSSMRISNIAYHPGWAAGAAGERLWFD